jgi:hypothetical protein
MSSEVVSVQSLLGRVKKHIAPWRLGLDWIRRRGETYPRLAPCDVVLVRSDIDPELRRGS